MGKREDFRFEELIKYREWLYQTMNYSVHRIDILIITLSTSGIALVTILMQKESYNSEYCLKLAISFFVASIITNLLSQFIAYQQNRNLMEIYVDKVSEYINMDKTEDFDWAKFEEKEREEDRFTFFIHCLNWTSFFCLVVGMVSVLAYFLD